MVKRTAESDSHFRHYDRKRKRSKKLSEKVPTLPTIEDDVETASPQKEGKGEGEGKEEEEEETMKGEMRSER